MWLLDRLIPQRPRPTAPELPGIIPECASRRAPLKRAARVGRSGIAPWQKVTPPRRH